MAQHEIDATDGAGAVEGAGPEGRAQRQARLKEVIRKLHDGVPVDEVKAEFDALTVHLDATEIAAMEQALIAEGMPVEEVRRLCDVHVSVFKDSLERPGKPGAAGALPPNHPVSEYLRENQAAAAAVASARGALERESLPQISAALDGLAPLSIHFRRKENQLFPALERHDVSGPTKVMWALDDDILGRLKTARVLLGSGDLRSLAAVLGDTLTMIDDMIYKEEKILFPTALQVVTESEWAEIAAGDHEIGFAWAEDELGPEQPREAASAVTPAMPAAANDAGGPMLLPLPTGALTLEQLDVMMRVLPFDISFVDENDRVRFYTEGERVFPRSPGAIGREIRNCHPPASVHKVEEILTAFKNGEKDVAEFWIELGERFIHIRYFAMRDTRNDYRGCLEVVHDATHVRSLSGQRRLVEW